MIIPSVVLTASGNQNRRAIIVLITLMINVILYFVFLPNSNILTAIKVTTLGVIITSLVYIYMYLTQYKK